MTWTYDQSTGDLNHDGVYEGRGYSGVGAGLNNGAMEAKDDVGPIPRGSWKIGPPHKGEHTGPTTMNLDPVGHDAHGRSLFRIHGDNKLNNRTASQGCIILGPAIRKEIAASGDTELVVVA
jgi:hypothetical protein